MPTEILWYKIKLYWDVEIHDNDICYMHSALYSWSDQIIKDGVEGAFTEYGRKSCTQRMERNPERRRPHEGSETRYDII